MKRSLPNESNAHLGTGMANLASILRRIGYKNAKFSRSDDLKSLLRATSLKSPIIVAVAWEDGGSHFSVVCGHETKAYLVLDPYYGAGWLQMPRDDVGGIKQPTYQPAHDARGHLNGAFVSVV